MEVSQKENVSAALPLISSSELERNKADSASTTMKSTRYSEELQRNIADSASTIQSISSPELQRDTADSAATTMKSTNPSELQRKTADCGYATTSWNAFEDGYGDFCFGRKQIWDLEKDKDQCLLPFDRLNPEEWTMADFLAGSSAIPFDDFLQGDKPFKFFKLPFEIRRKIYRLVLLPCMQFNPDLNQSVITFDIHEKPTIASFPVRTLATPEKRLQMDIRELVISGVPAPVMTSEEMEKTLAFYHKEQDSIRRQIQSHPSREIQYDVEINVPKYVVDPKQQNLDWGMVDLLRRIGNVSKQFRKEFGKEIWANTDISARLEDQTALLGFLAERPAIHGGIKSLDLGFSLDREESSTYRPSFLSAVDFMAKNLKNLQHIDLCVFTCEEQLHMLVAGAKELKPLEEFRKLKVASSFNFKLWVPFEDDPHLTDQENADREKHVEELEEKYTPLIREILLPDTLRISKPKTEEELYLEDRSAL